MGERGTLTGHLSRNAAMTQSEACAARIRREHGELQSLIAAALPAPEGHAWLTDRLHFTWYLNDALASTEYGCHLYLRPDEARVHDADQLRIEVRWFWRAGPDTPPRYAARTMRETACERAIVWCEIGPNIVGRSRTLLQESAGHLRADGIAALAEAAIALLRPAMARWEVERGTVSLATAA